MLSSLDNEKVLPFSQFPVKSMLVWAILSLALVRIVNVAVSFMGAGLDLLTPGAPSGMTRTTLSGWPILCPQLVGGWSLYSLEARAQEHSQRSCRDQLKLEQQVTHPKFCCALLLKGNHRMACVWREWKQATFLMSCTASVYRGGRGDDHLCKPSTILLV